jgi:hypothetical protein
MVDSECDPSTHQSSMKILQARLADAPAWNDPKASGMIRLLKASRGK